MGLSLNVGFLADLLENDPEGADWFGDDLKKLNSLLDSRGLARHEEPRQCNGWSCDLHGYSGLHYLRRYAAYLDLTGEPPVPGDDNAGQDRMTQQYYEAFDKPADSLMNRIRLKKAPTRTFDHLMIHSDAEGYYVPQDFAEVLVATAEGEVPDDYVGSSFRLLEETSRLARSLELPADIDPDCDELGEAAESQGDGGSRWERYGVESYTCARLMAAAKKSIEQSALLVFA